jgi:uncharacterized cupredoxin-like copper-binding protein
MRSVRLIVTTLAVCAYPVQPVFAEMEHRMGGLPGMPAHVLKPGGEFEHHQQFHPGPARSGAEMMFSFGQPGDPRAVKRRIHIEARENRFEVANLEFESRETVEFEFRNMDTRPHELRVGNPRYQQEHAEMLKRMLGWEHSSPNSVIVAPGKIATLVWQFGDDPVVELACHVAGSYEAGMLVRVQVTKP